MKLSVIGSSSAGNCYLLTSSTGETLIVECGVDFKIIKKALDWKLSSVCGCIVSHEHKDHCKSLSDVLASGIRTLGLEEVLYSQDLKKYQSFFTPVAELQGYKLGDFKILTLPVKHDVPCLAYVITHSEMGSLLFVTDTMSFDYEIPKLSHILIEANYSEDLLSENILTGEVAAAQGKRTRRSHLELQSTKNILRATDLTQTQEVILLHLSSRNSDRELFREEISKVTGLPTYIAGKDLTLDLNVNAI